jgi:hypothetical protein
MKRMAAVVLMVGSLSMAGQASAHGGDGGEVAGALIGGAVIGALVGSAVSAPPVYAQPVYAQPVYAQPVYAQPVYAPGAPPGYCYDQYQRAYVACAPAPQQGYYPQQQQPQGYYPQQQQGY